MKGFVIGLLCAAFLLVGCRKDIQNPEAVRQGMLDYLAKRPDLTAMDVSIGSVAFRKDEADALVYFRAKNGPANSGMEMKYVLERNGNRWVVKGRAGSGTAGNPHPGMATAPSLPPGHPPITPQQSTPPLP